MVYLLALKKREREKTYLKYFFFFVAVKVTYVFKDTYGYKQIKGGSIFMIVS